MSAHQPCQPRGCQPQEGSRPQPQQECQPHPVNAGPQPPPTATGPEQARRRCGRCVGQEDEQAHRRRQDRGGQRQARQAHGTEMADHRRVRQHEERLGDQSPQRWQGQGQDLTIETGGRRVAGIGHCPIVDHRELLETIGSRRALPGGGRAGDCPTARARRRGRAVEHRRRQC